MSVCIASRQELQRGKLQLEGIAHRALEVRFGIPLDDGPIIATTRVVETIAAMRQCIRMPEFMHDGVRYNPLRCVSSPAGQRDQRVFSTYIGHARCLSYVPGSHGKVGVSRRRVARVYRRA